ncbi:EboA domain-containing protein [Streptomyces tsukubensis]|uniref:Sugar phosphate isomerase n=1 Tax=Streptomyces tsukubensis TaxID=83656 RepID=A0A1V4AE61_9ACTN|nr:EboA domain-containing protein [Streptomyces tsukubensis]OON81786.1 sugar phosphate isomerase [Streptomyces tsukubensis]QFR96575.1 sugar phosphate isomerase [Streptomyces tsukubensis]
MTAPWSPTDLQPPAALRARLDAALPGAARAWLGQALAEAAQETSAAQGVPGWERRFAEAGRRCGADHADTARVLLLNAARAGADTLARVYGQGSGPERRAVLESLPHLLEGDEGVPLVEDALRANDTALVAAAVGPYAAEHLDAHAWRHAVLKCLFTGVTLDAVAGLPERARGDRELARMLDDFAAERTAAGRPVPDDLRRARALADGASPTADQRESRDS